MSEAGMGGAEIAIVGLSGRFPGAPSVADFWRSLREGVEAIRFFSDEELLAAGVAAEELSDPRYVKAAGVLGGVELFDAGLFGLGPREAEVMDPQHRVFLECAWEALEDAGHDPERFPGWIGVYAGAALNSYLWMGLARSPELLRSVGVLRAMIANEKDHLPTQVSYRLNLRGPSVNVQTACSSSLVAVHLACQGLLCFECDLALAGGVSIAVPEVRGYLYQDEGIGSPDGHCRPFDARAAGTVRGSGAGIVVLRRLGDALASGDRVLAVIKGSAINNDGASKVGYTAPSVSGQAEVIAAAQAVSGVAPETISYVEAHGTGTGLGDPIEVAALAEAFRSGATGGSGAGSSSSAPRVGWCALGSVKSNVGHLDAAAGVTGLIKTVLSLVHQELPASLHYERPNPKIDFASSPFFVNAARRRWEAEVGPRRAGVSSFGIGGTNAHVVLEEAPQAAVEAAVAGERGEGRQLQVLALSARSAAALGEMGRRLARHLREEAVSLADAAYTLQVGRRALGWRQVVLAGTGEEASARLEEAARLEMSGREVGRERAAVAFLFPGQGSPYEGMGEELCRKERVFREVVEECCGQLEPRVAVGVRSWLCSRATAGMHDDVAGVAPAEPDQAVVQVGLLVFELALARLWQSWGVEAEAVLGHSVGEYAAACVAGVMSVADALELVSLRGGLMAPLSGGAMLSVALSEEELRGRLGRGLEVAAVNAPRRCVVSGAAEEVAELARRLAEEGVEARRVRGSHAFHSRWMEPVLERLGAGFARVSLAAPRVRYVSGLSGEWVAGDGREVRDPAYWLRQLREPVRFGAGVERLLEEPGRVLLEVGPGGALSQLAGLVMETAGGGAWQAPGSRAVGGEAGGSGGEVLVVSGLRGGPGGGSSATAVRAEEKMLAALGRLWERGVPVDWEGFHAGEKRRRVALPRYPFERQRYWLEGGGEEGERGPGEESATDRAAFSQGGRGADDSSEAGTAERRGRLPPRDWFWAPSWQRSLPPAPARPRTERMAEDGDGRGAATEPSRAPRCVVFVDAWGLGEALGRSLAEGGWEVVRVAAGDPWQEAGPGRYQMRPGHAEDHLQLWEELSAGDGPPELVLHLWNVTAPREPVAVSRPPTGSGLAEEDPAAVPGTASGPAAGVVEPAAGVAEQGFVPSQGMERSFFSLLHLAQGLGRQQGRSRERGGVPRRVEVVVFATGLHAVESGDRPEPVKALLLGPCRVMPQEMEGVSCRSVDVVLGPGGRVEPELVARCWSELGAGGAPIPPHPASPPLPPIVALRGPHRWLPAWEPVRFGESPSGSAGAGVSASGLRRGGVYLITGGLGGLGLAVAGWLSERLQARLVLVGRRELPARESWAEWLAERGEGDAVGRILRRLLSLEERGAELLVVSADVSDAGRMEEVRREVAARWGRVEGVFHAAGVAGGALLQGLSAERAAAVLAPKVRGTAVLARSFGNADFLVLFSSLASLLGGIGQADYSAANAFLDSFSAAAAAGGALHPSAPPGSRSAIPAVGETGDAACLPRRVLAVSWDAWAEVGMAVETALPEPLRAWSARQLEEAIRPEEGCEALERALALPWPGASQVVVSTRSLGGRLAAAERLRLHALLAESAGAGGDGGWARRARHPRPLSGPPYVAPEGELEERLAEYWQELLGIAPVGREDHFFDLGGHSLLAIQLATRVREGLGLELPLETCFAHPTLESLARAIRPALGSEGAAGAATATRPLSGAVLRPLPRQSRRVQSGTGEVTEAGSSSPS